MCRETKVGDVILFPNDKGIPAGEVEYISIDGSPKIAKNGIFLGEHRIFATLTNYKDVN